MTALHRWLLQLLESMLASRDGWRHGYALRPDQRAALVREAWSLPPAYTVTQPGDQARAAELIARCRAIYRRAPIDLPIQDEADDH